MAFIAVRMYKTDFETGRQDNAGEWWLGSDVEQNVKPGDIYGDGQALIYRCESESQANAIADALNVAVNEWGQL